MRSPFKLPAAVAVTLCMATPSIALAGQVPPPPKKAAPEKAPAPEKDADPGAGLSDEEKQEKAKGLYVEAEGLAEAGDFEGATPKYETAYFLVPGKHGFAYKVGYSAWQVKDCIKADQYLKHYVKYGDPNKHPDWMEEAKSILGEISVSGCADKAETPATTTEVKTPGADEDAPILSSRSSEREAANERARKDAKADKKGLLVGGAVLLGVGAGALGMGIGTNFWAKNEADKLQDLSSNATVTGFPQGSWPDEGQQSDKNRRTANALAITGYAVGGVAITAGVALIVLHVQRKKKNGGGKNAKSDGAEPKAELTGLGPALFRSGAGASASLRF